MSGIDRLINHYICGPPSRRPLYALHPVCLSVCPCLTVCPHSRRKIDKENNAVTVARASVSTGASIPPEAMVRPPPKMAGCVPPIFYYNAP